MTAQGQGSLGWLIICMLGIAIAIFALPIFMLLAAAVAVYVTAAVVVQWIRGWFR